MYDTNPRREQNRIVARKSCQRKLNRNLNSEDEKLRLKQARHARAGESKSGKEIFGRRLQRGAGYH